MRALTEAEFNEWKAHPMTRALIEILHAKRETLRQQWEGGSFTDYEKDTTALINVGNLGACKGYAFVTDFTYEDYIGELDDKQERTGATGSGGPDQNV
jgi:hypothetical protein